MSGDELALAELSLTELAARALVEVDDAVLLVDPHGVCFHVNPAAAKWFGRDCHGWAAEFWSAKLGFYREDEHTPWPPSESPVVRALAGHASRHVPMFLRNDAVPNGVHLAATCVPFIDEKQVLRGAVLMFRDMTEMRKRDAQLREAARQVKAILDHIKDMAWMKDLEGRFLAVNARHSDMYGIPVERWIGKTDFDMYPRELAERFRADDAEVIRTGTQRCVEEVLVDIAGVEHIVETIKVPVLGEDGKIIGTTGTARDITGRKKAAEMLKLTADELERRVRERTDELAVLHETLIRQERLAVLGQLAGGVAHQIRNPLGAIMNATSVLLRHVSHGRESTGDATDAVHIIQDEVRRVDAIIRGLLTYARVRAPSRRPTSILDLVTRVLAADWIPSTIRVERQFVEVPLVDADPDQIQSAITNLVQNAVEAMPDGGVLRVEIAFRESSHEVIVSISDTGPGISADLGKHLFQPLQSTKPTGIGLGLVTARTLIEAHGGQIVSIDAQVGARFEIRVPTHC